MEWPYLQCIYNLLSPQAQSPVKENVTTSKEDIKQEMMVCVYIDIV